MAWKNLEWETVDGHVSIEHNASEVVRRARVPGGWLVQAATSVSGAIKTADDEDAGRQLVMAESMTYVPDPEHSWSIEPFTDQDFEQEASKMELLHRIYN